jgi:hypothetical protein
MRSPGNVFVRYHAPNENPNRSVLSVIDVSLSNNMISASGEKLRNLGEQDTDSLFRVMARRVIGGEFEISPQRSACNLCMHITRGRFAKINDRNCDNVSLARFYKNPLAACVNKLRIECYWPEPSSLVISGSSNGGIQGRLALSDAGFQFGPVLSQGRIQRFSVLLDRGISGIRTLFHGLLDRCIYPAYQSVHLSGGLPGTFFHQLNLAGSRDGVKDGSESNKNTGPHQSFVVESSLLPSLKYLHTVAAILAILAGLACAALLTITVLFSDGSLGGMIARVALYGGGLITSAICFFLADGP